MNFDIKSIPLERCAGGVRTVGLAENDADGQYFLLSQHIDIDRHCC